MRNIAIIGGLLLTARVAHAGADCTYHNGYYDPGLDGACVAEASVPAGCPVHFVTPHGQPPATFTVHRGAQDVTLPATRSLVEAVGVPMSVVDPFDCDCTQTDATVMFDRQALTLTGAQAGDVVDFTAGHLPAPQTVAITAAGPCPAVAWPIQLQVATQCDRCPEQPPQSSGCSTGGSGGLAMALAVVFVARSRRRSDRR